MYVMCAVGTATRALAYTATQDVAPPRVDKGRQALSLKTLPTKVLNCDNNCDSRISIFRGTVSWG